MQGPITAAGNVVVNAYVDKHAHVTRSYAKNVNGPRWEKGAALFHDKESHADICNTILKGMVLLRDKAPKYHTRSVLGETDLYVYGTIRRPLPCLFVCVFLSVCVCVCVSDNLNMLPLTQRSELQGTYPLGTYEKTEELHASRQRYQAERDMYEVVGVAKTSSPQSIGSNQPAELAVQIGGLVTLYNFGNTDIKIGDHM